MGGKSKLIVVLSGITVVVIACFILYKPLINYLTSQASNPEGFIGKVITKIWSGYFQDLSEWSFTHVNLGEHDTILDVGFGGGANIKYIKERDTESTVYGVDISEEAVKNGYRIKPRICRFW